MNENELLYILALQRVEKIGDITAKKLISHCGSAEAVFKEKKQSLLNVVGVGSIMMRDLFKSEHLKAAEKEMHFIKGLDIQFAKVKEV